MTAHDHDQETNQSGSGIADWWEGLGSHLQGVGGHVLLT